MTTIAPGLDSTVSNIENATSSTNARAAADLNFDTFLRLLTTQLQNQDPLNPLDGTQFTEQIASFSALEQQIATNANLEKMLQGQDFSQQSMAVGFIGKEVLATGNVASLENGKMEFAYSQKKDAAATSIEIFSPTGERVATIEGETAAGQHNIVWDGENEDGEAQPEGQYLIRVSSVDGEGTSVEPRTLTFQEVLGVRSDGEGNVFLGLPGDREISLSDQFTVRTPPEENNNPV